MAKANNKGRCVKCGKENAILKCEGCMATFCYNHVLEHRQELNRQLDEMGVIRDTIRQTLSQQIAEPEKHALVEQINEWERKSIEKIRQTADEARQVIVEHTSKYNANIEVKLNKLTDQLRVGRQENDFFETDLDRWKQALAKLNHELTKPSKIRIQHHSTSLVEKISIDICTISNIPNISPNARWMQNGTTVVGGNASENGINQLYYVYGFYIDDEQTIYAADYGNHRIVAWKNGATNGQVVAGGNGAGNQANQLNFPIAVIVDKETDSLIISDQRNLRVVRWPRQNGTSGEILVSDVISYGLIMDGDGYLYVADFNKHEVKRWKIGETNGIVVAGGNGQGNRLDQLNSPTCIFVDQENSVYVSDYNNHRVMKWIEGAKEGIAVAGGQGPGNGLTQLSYPRGIVVDELGTVYVVDRDNNRLMRWPKGAAQGSVVAGGNGPGKKPNQFNGCWGLSADSQGNLYVADCNNSRVQKFNIDPNSNV